MTPTWYGEILIRQARWVLSEINRAQEEIAALKSGLTGQASIGTVMNPGTNLVPMAVAQLKQKHPRMLVSVELDYSKPLVAKLLKGELDIVIARILDSRGADQGWILPPPGSLIRDRLISVFLQRGLVAPGNLGESFSLPVISSLLRTTDMVVALPKETVLRLRPGRAHSLDRRPGDRNRRLRHCHAPRSAFVARCRDHAWRSTRCGAQALFEQMSGRENVGI